MGESLGSFLTIGFPSTWFSIALVDASAVADDTHNRDGRHGWLSEFRCVITFHTMPQIVTDPKLSTIVRCMPSVFLSFISVTAAFLARLYALSKSQGQKAGAREFRSERQRKVYEAPLDFTMQIAMLPQLPAKAPDRQCRSLCSQSI